MLHLFHGENIQASRKELNLYKDKYDLEEIIILDGKQITETDLIQSTQTNSLFNQKRLVIIENLFKYKLGKFKKDLENSSWLKIINQIPKKEVDIIFWEEKEIGKTIIKLLPQSLDLAIFQYDKILWKFLELIRPENTTQLLTTFDELIVNESVELVFSMMVRQFRLLIMVKDKTPNLDLNSWQLNKLTQQTQHFTFNHILDLYKQLLNIDQQQKTSISPFNLTEELKLFLIKV